jgi:hypothetical protein
LTFIMKFWGVERKRPTSSRFQPAHDGLHPEQPYPAHGAAIVIPRLLQSRVIFFASSPPREGPICPKGDDLRPRDLTAASGCFAMLAVDQDNGCEGRETEPTMPARSGHVPNQCKPHQIQVATVHRHHELSPQLASNAASFQGRQLRPIQA